MDHTVNSTSRSGSAGRSTPSREKPIWSRSKVTPPSQTSRPHVPFEAKSTNVIQLRSNISMRNSISEDYSSERTYRKSLLLCLAPRPNQGISKSHYKTKQEVKKATRTIEMSSTQADELMHDERSIRLLQQKKSIPEIDFTLHTMEDGTQVEPQERVVKPHWYPEATMSPPRQVNGGFVHRYNPPEQILHTRGRPDLEPFNHPFRDSSHDGSIYPSYQASDYPSYPPYGRNPYPQRSAEVVPK